MRFETIDYGTIAQITHLPYLTGIPETELYALVNLFQRYPEGTLVDARQHA